MDKKVLSLYIEKLADIIGIEINEKQSGFGDFDELRENRAENIDVVLNEVMEAAQNYDLAMLKNEVSELEFKNLLYNLGFPIIVFKEMDGLILPVIIEKVEDNVICHFYQNNQLHSRVYKGEHEELIRSTEPGVKNKILLLTVFPVAPLFSQKEKPYRNFNRLSIPVIRLWNLLMTEKKDIVYLFTYAVMVGLVSLTIPLGIQAIISLISGGLMINSVVVLIAAVIIATIISGGLQVMQITIVEILQRRVFAKAAFEISYRIPKMNLEYLSKYYPPELINRFFDVLTIQKGYPKLLIDIVAALLQIIFGLALLAFYHPIFVGFGALTVLVLFTVFYITGPKGLETNLIESDYKYKVVYWLQETARSVQSFKLVGFSNLSVDRMDELVSKYLSARRDHFNVLISQFASMIIFKVFIVGILLILGSYLVVDRQITLGQFVASEIVIILILASVEKLIGSIDVVYDMLVAAEKVGKITDVPLESSNGALNVQNVDKGIDLKLRNLSYTYKGAKSPVLSGIDMDIPSNRSTCICGFDNSGKNTLATTLYGLNHNYSGSIRVNNTPLKDFKVSAYRDMIGYNGDVHEIIHGTILENLTMGRSDVSMDQIYEACDVVELTDYINGLADGFSSMLNSAGRGLSLNIAHKILLARMLIKKPKIVIIKDFFHSTERKYKIKIFKYLLEKERNWTTLAITNDPIVMSLFDNICILKGGKLVNQGTYNELLGDDYFNEIIN